MSEIPVAAESPSATVQPKIVEPVRDEVVSWNPDRGWLCSAHLAQPCEHTEGLVPAKHPEWRQ